MGKVFVVANDPCCGRGYHPSVWGRMNPSLWRLGVLMTSSGNRGFHRVGDVMEPGELPPGVFELMKGRLLAAVRAWVTNGWLDLREVLEIVGMGMVAGCPVAHMAAEGVGRSPMAEVAHLGPGLRSPTWEAGRELKLGGDRNVGKRPVSEGKHRFGWR